MDSMTTELRARPLVGGLLSYIPRLYAWWDNRRPTGNTASSSYSRGIWAFHCENYRQANQGEKPRVVAELGPGATLATCIAALCDGMEHAIGLDVCPYADSVRINRQMLDELWPPTAAPDAKRQAIADAIDRLGSPDSRPPLQYVAPWNSDAALPESCLDFVFSHSVLEHVDHPAHAYAACFRWLRAGGLMSHKIDHSSHGITKSWNGHYALPLWLWSLIRGGRPYLLNRITTSQHRAMIRAAGFEILQEIVVEASSADRSTRCSLQIDASDARIKTTTFVCRKPA